MRGEVEDDDLHDDESHHDTHQHHEQADAGEEAVLVHLVPVPTHHVQEGEGWKQSVTIML